MIDRKNVPEVGSQETLARYVLFHSHVRQDCTVKPDAFMPPPDRELSVTRHVNATNTELWEIGEDVAKQRQKPLLGRADLGVIVCRSRKLTVQAAPLSANPNHAHVLGWPDDKPAQKMIAQELAAKASFVSPP